MKYFDLLFIKTKRKMLNLTLQDMADELEFKNASTYMKYENGAYEFKATHLPKLSKSLQCDIKDFYKNKIAESEIIDSA